MRYSSCIRQAPQAQEVNYIHLYFFKVRDLTLHATRLTSAHSTRFPQLHLYCKAIESFIQQHNERHGARIQSQGSFQP